MHLVRRALKNRDVCAMGDVDCWDGTLPAVRRQPSCIWCELVCVLLRTLLEQTIAKIETWKIDLQFFLAVADKFLGQQQLQTGGVGTSVAIPHLQVATEHVQVLQDFFLSPNLPEELVTRKAVWKQRRTSSGTSWIRETGARPEVGAKTRLGGVIQQYVSERCAISRGHGAPKRVKIVRPYPESSTYKVSYKDDCWASIFNAIILGLSSRDSTPLGDTSLRVGKPTIWESLPNDLHENVLQKLEFRDLFRFKTLSKSCREYIESDVVRRCRDAAKSEGVFTAIIFHIKSNQWRCSGYDLSVRMWKHLPSLSPALPVPNPDLFKEYTVCGHGALICADIAKLPEKGQVVVLNPLTKKKKTLPQLLYPRSPVLIHIWVDSGSGSFKVIVAGSSASSDEKLSRKIEVFDSETWVWEAAPDLPGPTFGLNEHQVGVCVDGVLHFISFLDGSGDGSRGVVAFDLKSKTWLSNRACPIPFSKNSNTLQLVESKGKVCLFSEQEVFGLVNHCIDVLELVDHEKWKLRNVVRVKKSGGRGLQVYPEYTCVSFGGEKLCIFNTLTRSGVVYDMQDGKGVGTLEPPPFDQEVGDNFFSLNPASFVLEPSFDNDLGLTNQSLGACGTG